MDIFAQAYAQMTKSGKSGQAALSDLYDAIPTGKVRAAEILPLVSEIMRERAEPKLGVLRKSSIAEQARVRNTISDLVNTFSTSGGEEGFSRFFRSANYALTGLTPVVESLGQAFNWLSKALEGPMLLMGDMGQLFERTKDRVEQLNPAILELSALGLALTTKWGRVGAMFSMIYLVMEDIVGWVNGRDSAIGLVMDKMQEFVSFDKDIMAMSMSVLTLAAAFKILSTSMSLIPDIFNQRGKKGKTPDIDLPDVGKSQKGGAIGKWLIGLGLPATIMGATAWGLDEIGFFDKMSNIKENMQPIVDDITNPKSILFDRMSIGDAKKQYPGGLGVLWNNSDEFLESEKYRVYAQEQAQKFDQTVAAIQQMQSLGYSEDKIKSALGSTSFNLPYDFEYAGNVYNPSNVHQAVQDASTVNNNSNTTITNQFDIKIDGVIDPAGLESVFEEQVMPRVESWWTNELGNVNMSFGSK